MDKKAVYLTFDDGPTLELTTWILDYLEKEQELLLMRLGLMT